MKIADKTVVLMHYTLTSDEGQVIDSSAGRDPLQYIQGMHMIVVGLEKAMYDHEVGDKFDVKVIPSEGYGEYDERMTVAGDFRMRPDFYLPEFDVYIEYFGMNTPEYRDNMLKKRILYQRAGKKLVSVSYEDADPVSVLRQKLSRYFRI